MNRPSRKNLDRIALLSLTLACLFLNVGCQEADNVIDKVLGKVPAPSSAESRQVVPAVMNGPVSLGLTGTPVLGRLAQNTPAPLPRAQPPQFTNSVMRFLSSRPAPLPHAQPPQPAPIVQAPPPAVQGAPAAPPAAGQAVQTAAAAPQSAPTPAALILTALSGKMRNPGIGPPTGGDEGRRPEPFSFPGRDPFREPTEMLPPRCLPSQPLCKFDHSQLRLVGVMQVSDGNYKGMVEDPEGRGYFVTTGMMIGRATVTQIGNKGVILHVHKTNNDVLMPMSREGRDMLD